MYPAVSAPVVATCRRTATPLWLWPNLLSLDAPLVALVWQDFLARCYPSVILPAGRAALFLAVWGIYIADRLIDARSPESATEAARHSFYRRHAGFAHILLAAVAVLLLTALTWMRPAVIRNGLLVAAFTAAYLAVFPLRAPLRNVSGKRPCAAMLFTIGVFLVSWTFTPEALRTLAAPALAFGGLCFANMVLVERWERDERAPGLRAGAILLALLCLLGQTPWYAAIAAAAAALAALDFMKTCPRDARGVLADLVLLTPLLLR